MESEPPGDTFHKIYSLQHSIILVIFSVLSQYSYSQPSGLSLSSAFTGTCTYSSIHADAFSFLQNQAALPAVKSFSAGISAERRYLLQELAHYEAALVVPVPGGAFGFIGSYFGSSAYRDASTGVAYGRRINKIDVALQGTYRNAGASGYSANTSINIEGGIMFQISDQLRIGFHVFDPVSLQLKNNDLPVTSFSAGAGYDASESFHFEIVLQKEESIPVNIIAAIHYAAGEKIFFRTGISCSTPMLFAGAGCYMHDFRIDVIATYHPFLGITPAMAIIFQKQK
jgi:hypothetical protein